MSVGDRCGNNTPKCLPDWNDIVEGVGECLGIWDKATQMKVQFFEMMVRDGLLRFRQRPQ